MATLVRDVMTADPVTMPAKTPVIDAAKTMRDSNIGDVIVLDGDNVCGIVTDRDVVIRQVAEGKSPKTTKLGHICSKELTTVTPDTPIDEAVDVMRQKAIRRLPVVENGRPIGIVSIGDLAVDRDPNSALADISAAPPNS